MRPVHYGILGLAALVVAVAVLLAPTSPPRPEPSPPKFAAPFVPPAPNGNPAADALAKEAFEAAQQEDYATAVIRATDALRLQPNHAAALNVRGVAYYAIGNAQTPPNMVQMGKGVRDIEQAIALDKRCDIQSARNLIENYRKLCVLMGLD